MLSADRKTAFLASQNHLIRGHYRMSDERKSFVPQPFFLFVDTVNYFASAFPINLAVFPADDTVSH